MTLFDASGTASGSSAASGSALVRVRGAGTFLGSSAFTGLAGVNQLSSARFQGASAFAWDYFVEASATIAGTSAASAEGFVVANARAIIQGTSRFFYITPLVIWGSSTFSVVTFVDHQLPPIKAMTMGPKAFRWLQTLQRGDLSIFICQGRNAMIPARIAYSLVQVRLDGSKKHVGPQNRTPVPGEVGEFYASGRAGESGQPGQWLIEWLYQLTPQSKIQKTVMPFQVLDAVAVGDPRDSLQRRIKFGWS